MLKRFYVPLLVFAALQSANAYEVATTPQLEVAFSPNEGAEELVVKTINSAKYEIRILSYSFTNSVITKALIAAKHRGLSVTIVADEKNNLQESGGKGRAALAALANAGCEVRVINVYPIHHDKTIIVDHVTVETGSFNFSQAAAHHNSENVLVVWNSPDLARTYLHHFERTYKASLPFSPN